MSNLQAQRFYWRIVIWLPIIIFPFALIIFGFSSCDLRKRSDKAACRAGSVEKCLAVGQYYDDKRGGIISFLMNHADTAMVYYHQACKLKSGTGCERLMYIFKHGEQAKNLSIELVDIADTLINACADRVSGACEELWSFMDSGDWVAARSGIAFKRLCDSGKPMACFRLGALHGKNLGGLKNVVDEVLPLYEKACTASIENSCQMAEAYRARKAELARPR